MDTSDFREKVEELSGDLDRLVDRLEVKGSLLKLESRDAWTDLKKGLRRVKAALRSDLQETRQDLDEARVQAHLGVMEAKEEWEEFKGFVHNAVDELKKGEAKIDEASIKAHLGLMEAKDRFSEKKKQWKEKYHQEVKPAVSEAHKQMQKEVRAFVDSIGG